MPYPRFPAPTLLLPFSRSNAAWAVSLSDWRIWEPQEASQFVQWELSERDVINPAYTLPVERCQENSLAYAQTGIEFLLVGNCGFEYTRRREIETPQSKWIGRPL